MLPAAHGRRIPHDRRIRLDVDGARYEGPFEWFAADTLSLRPTDSIESDDHFDSESTNEPPVLCLAGAASGIVLGAVIGQFMPHWSLRDP
jgi:hypothetical protein